MYGVIPEDFNFTGWCVFGILMWAGNETSTLLELTSSFKDGVRGTKLYVKIKKLRNSVVNTI
jgi:hypothetical protein